MNTWEPGRRVQWQPDPREWMLWGDQQTGVVADAPCWPAIDPMIAGGMAAGERIPVDLDTPITWSNSPDAPARHVGRYVSRPYTYTRVWVREQFLRPYEEPTDE